MGPWICSLNPLTLCESSVCQEIVFRNRQFLVSQVSINLFQATLKETCYLDVVVPFVYIRLQNLSAIFEKFPNSSKFSKFIKVQVWNKMYCSKCDTYFFFVALEKVRPFAWSSLQSFYKIRYNYWLYLFDNIQVEYLNPHLFTTLIFHEAGEMRLVNAMPL